MVPDTVQLYMHKCRRLFKLLACEVYTSPIWGTDRDQARCNAGGCNGCSHIHRALCLSLLASLSEVGGLAQSSKKGLRNIHSGPKTGLLDQGKYMERNMSGVWRFAPVSHGLWHQNASTQQCLTPLGRVAPQSCTAMAECTAACASRAADFWVSKAQAACSHLRWSRLILNVVLKTSPEMESRTFTGWSTPEL